jgi:hypothetical protein
MVNNIVSFDPASLSHVGESELFELVWSHDSDVRLFVAGNPKTKFNVLPVLAADKEWFVRAEAAKHPQIPVSVLQLLVEDSAWSVRAAVAEHPKTPVQALEVLSKVRECVVLNPNVPKFLAVFLVEDSHRCVSDAALDALRRFI